MIGPRAEGVDHLDPLRAPTSQQSECRSVDQCWVTLQHVLRCHPTNRPGYSGLFYVIGHDDPTLVSTRLGHQRVPEPALPMLTNTLTEAPRSDTSHIHATFKAAAAALTWATC